jgi:VanZ family protein
LEALSRITRRGYADGSEARLCDSTLARTEGETVIFWTLTFVVFAALAVASMFRLRFAYATFVVLGVLWMPARAWFRWSPTSCETAMSIPLAAHSMTNYKHIVLFAMFAIMTLAQFEQDDRWRFLKLAVIALGMTVLVEGEQALLGMGHCRARDVVPNAAGTVVGACLLEAGRAFRTLRRRTTA